MLTYPPPLALYIHFPWCTRKCPYCDFNSHPLRGALPEAEYIDALMSDLEQTLPSVWGRRIVSLYLGGGTPSLFSPQALDRLLQGIRARLPHQPSMEITMEANPGTTNQARLRDYQNLGINRLSLGVQSLQASKLRALGRIHTREEALQAFEAARAASFDNINLDLIYGLPGQHPDEALQDLNDAMVLAPDHLSWYQLTIEPNTAFGRHPPVLPKEDRITSIETQGRSLLAHRGFEQYEISAYAQPSKASEHNLNYWTFGDYIGIGAGAHGKITDINTQTITRTWKEKHPKAYLDHNTPFLSGERSIKANELPLEFMMNALRLNKKIPLTLFEERTGLSTNHIQSALKDAVAAGLLQWTEDHIATTQLGKNFLNDLLAIF